MSGFEEIGNDPRFHVNIYTLLQSLLWRLRALQNKAHIKAQISASTKPDPAVRDIKCVTRNKYSAGGKILIILEGLRGETTITEICRREGLGTNLYYRWSKDFLRLPRSRKETPARG